MKKIAFAFLFVVLHGCYSHIGTQSETMTGSFRSSDTRTPFTRVSVQNFDGSSAFWTCVRLENQQVYNSINQAAYARQMGVGAFYMNVPTNIVQACRLQTSGNAIGGAMNPGIMLAPGTSAFQGGMFDANRWPMQIATGPNVALVPTVSGGMPNGETVAAQTAPANASVEAIDRRLGIVVREVGSQGRAIRRMESRIAR